MTLEVEMFPGNYTRYSIEFEVLITSQSTKDVMNLSTPMFKEFKEENDALEAVKKMKTKFSPTCINVINPFPQDRHTLSATDYGLPEENICYEGLQQSYQSKLLSCGFNATEITQLEREI